MDGRELAAVFAGGALGTAARAELAEAMVHDPGSWPWATFVVNVVAAALVGCLATRLPASGYGRPLLVTGLCGGLSTFATMQLELVLMLDGDRVGLALGYAIASVLAGFAAVALGASLSRRVR